MLWFRGIDRIEKGERLHDVYFDNVAKEDAQIEYQRAHHGVEKIRDIVNVSIETFDFLCLVNVFDFVTSTKRRFRQ